MTQQPTAAAVTITERLSAHIGAAARLAALGHINTVAGTTPAAVFDVSVNGTLIPVPVIAYEVVAGGPGTQVILTLAAEAVTIGKPKPAVTTAEVCAASVWGAPGKPDPRENIPGWAGQAADV